MTNPTIWVSTSKIGEDLVPAHYLEVDGVPVVAANPAEALGTTIYLARQRSGRLSISAHSRKSHDAQEKSQRPINAQEQGVVGLADNAAYFGGWHHGYFINRYLGNLAESILAGRLNLKPELIRVLAKQASQRANNDRSQFGEKIALHD